MRRMAIAAAIICLAVTDLWAQREIGYVERFALATDRSAVLADLIPGTEDYYFYHTLHLQNTRDLERAEAMLTEWRSRLGETPRSKNMLTRQVLLAYEANPKRTLDFLRSSLGLNFNHAPPSRDRAAQLATTFDASSYSIDRVLTTVIARDRSLNQFENSALPLLINQQLSVEQLRALLKRLDRPDLPQVVSAIAKELKTKDSGGFGWANAHRLLTRQQLDELLRLVPNLIENERFIRAYAAQLAPPEGTLLTDNQQMREYLNRLREFASRLPASQNSFKALVLGNLLRLDLTEDRYDRALFLEYLNLPRAANYYDLRRFRNRRPTLAELNFAMRPQVQLPAMGDDSALVQTYLEHFFQTDESVDDFAALLSRDYLDRVFAETKILFGVGDAATWYRKLSPSQQRALRDRIEIRFLAHNPKFWKADDRVELVVDLKNISELLVKVYEINTLALLRDGQQSIDTSLDLDGLVANHQFERTYSLPAERRHRETIDLPGLEGRGVWVVDLLGGGQRSRALIRKGELIAVERVGDAGHVFEILDEVGVPVENAHLEFGGRKYTSEEGQILVPFAEKALTRKIILVDEDFASEATFAHRSESYQLSAGFLVDRQSLVAGTQAAVAIHSRLNCNGQPVNVSLLENVRLTISATDLDGIATTQTFDQLTLNDREELVQTFLVPQRLKNLQLRLSGEIYNQSRGENQKLEVTHAIQCNGILQSAQIGDFFFQPATNGARLVVLGRNGEPLRRLPVQLTFKMKDLRQRRSASLATDDNGAIALRGLQDVESFVASAQGIQQQAFDLRQVHRQWPGRFQMQAGQTLTLPLGAQTEDRIRISLHERRRGVLHRDVSQAITIGDGRLQVGALEAGEYLLRDHATAQQTTLIVGDGKEHGRYIVGPNRILQKPQRPLISIAEASIDGESFVVKVKNADERTRVHVLAEVFSPSESHGKSMHLPRPPLYSLNRRPVQSHYVDSLKLDEEYSYILNRAGQQKFPGNLLPQPTMLVHPWEVSVTENQMQEARDGDAIPESPADAAMLGENMQELARKQAGSTPDWKSYDMLAGGALVLANLEVEDGTVSIPVADLAGYSVVNVLVVGPLSTDSRQVFVGKGDVPTRDGRLSNSFAEDDHLTQSQRVEFVLPGETKSLGDPKTGRIQTYNTIADVFQLYSTLLNDPTWEDFRFVTQWNQLAGDEKLQHYNEHACHELNYFLYHKDRQFFDDVVRPLLQNKLEQQLVDRWLMGKSIEPYAELWRLRRLNTLERVLLAQSMQSLRSGTVRWLDDFLRANPETPEALRQRFEVALRGSSLQSTRMLERYKSEEARMGQVMRFAAPQSRGRIAGGMPESVRLQVEAKAMNEAIVEGEAARGLALADDLFAIDRTTLGRSNAGFFQSLDKTREWAESQYYRTRLDSQVPELIAPGPFWQQLLEHDGQAFMPRDLEQPARNLHEALCALAVIDLPFQAEPTDIKVENDQLLVTAGSPTIVYLESIEQCDASESDANVLVGQDVYLAQPNAGESQNRPLALDGLVQGVPYRTHVVVTNPTSETREIQVLTQLPAGAVPLEGGKVSRSTSLRLKPYSTAQVKYAFYFPGSGEFTHYGAQVNQSNSNLVSTKFNRLVVAAEPVTVDQSTWRYVADWGTNEQVVEFLEANNIQQLDLSRIAFRMQDRNFYEQVIETLSGMGQFHAALWAYAVRHADAPRIEQLLQSRQDVLQQLGAAFESKLIQVRPDEQMSYEHLDYKPLVVARTHQLGAKAVILNPSMHRQYHRLLNVLAHSSGVSSQQRMQLCYYLLLQNRIAEAIEWFDTVDVEDLEQKIQYDYLHAYLDFYRGDYDSAKGIAGRYAEYPVPRWNDLFGQIRNQLVERDNILAAVTSQNEVYTASRGKDGSQNRLTDKRGIEQYEQAEKTATLDLENENGRLAINSRNLSEIDVHYYLMDIELLFSRKPFVGRSENSSPVIRPNHSEKLKLTAEGGIRELPVPEGLRNRNLLVEVTGGGLSRSTVVTASDLVVRVAQPFGQLKVTNRQGGAPITGAYVKVYARHRGGNIRFYKDGYTDLRGQFDYASLSTGDLDTAERFAILVLDEELGASVQEVNPPTR